MTKPLILLLHLQFEFCLKQYFIRSVIKWNVIMTKYFFHSKSIVGVSRLPFHVSEIMVIFFKIQKRDEKPAAFDLISR